MSEQISTIQTSEVLELMRNLAPILNQKELFEFMLFSNRVLKRYMPEYYNDELSEEVTEMRKDKAWLRDEVSELYPSYDEMYVSPDYETVAKTETISKVLELIDKLEEPEKPVIPQFVADWIEEAKDRKLTLYGAIHECPREVDYWLVDGDSSNQETFARAWLDGFTVEEEQKYYVLDSEDIPLLERANNQTYKTTTALSIYEDGRDNSKFELTEKEIKDYDERYWAFAEEVTE